MQGQDIGSAEKDSEKYFNKCAESFNLKYPVGATEPIDVKKELSPRVFRAFRKKNPRPNPRLNPRPAAQFRAPYGAEWRGIAHNCAPNSELTESAHNPRHFRAESACRVFRV